MANINSVTNSEEEIGYAVPMDWYKSYVENGKKPSEIKNRKIISEEGDLDRSSSFEVVGVKEWAEIKKKNTYDVEVPVGTVEVSLTLAEKEEIKKRFEVKSSKETFDVVKAVLFSQKMTEKDFLKRYKYTITGNIDIKEQLIKCGRKNVEITIERKETDTSSEEEEEKEKKPAEFRNLGLSCYMNTALQVLLGVEELSKSLASISTETIRALGQRKGAKGVYKREKCVELLLAYRSLVRATEKGEACDNKLREFKSVLGSIDTRYGKRAEEDAGEVFSLILNNFSYLFEKSKYENVVSDLFAYNTDLVKVFLDASSREVGREEKSLQKSFVLYGSFRSEKGAHAHVAVVHRKQLVITSFCVLIEEGGSLMVGKVKERIGREFKVEAEKIVAGEPAGEMKMLKRGDGFSFAPKKNLFEQPMFYIVGEVKEIEFMYLKYLPQKESGFFSSMFSGSDGKAVNMPFLIEKRRNITEFLEAELRIERRADAETVLEIKNAIEESELAYSSMCVVITHRSWDARKYLNAIKDRRSEIKDALHIQCAITNWEHRVTRKIRGEQVPEEVEAKKPVSFVEFTQFHNFSTYFCIQLPLGLGGPFKGEKFGDRTTPYIEKDGLILKGVRYSLVGVLVHHNFGIGGHYVAFTKRGKTWYHCNDSTITKSTVDEAVSTGYPYGILYRREN